MIYGLLLVILPITLGYCIKLQQIKWLNIINKSLMICLYLILFVMGITLGQLDNLIYQLPKIGINALTFSIIIQSCNVVALAIFDKSVPTTFTQDSQQPLPDRFKLLFDSFKLCFVTILGGLCGYFLKENLTLSHHFSSYLLFILIFLVGIQLRNSGIPLKEVFLNKRGIITAVIFILSALVGGIIAAYWLGIPLEISLAISSGFGWYSLSSVLINDTWGAIYGSTAFFNDLLREIVCLFSIPFFIQRFPSTAVGLSGATAIDCSLPIIQRAGGTQIIPLAFSFGVIINLAVPLLLALFISMA